jgi:sugar phosphate isomerase/epimerase
MNAKNGALRFGVIVDIQAALEMVAGGGRGGSTTLAGLNFDAIDPVAIVRQAHDRHGVNIIELPADVNYVIPDILARNIEGLRKLRDELGLEYTIHLPYIYLDLCALNPHVRAASVETIVETIKACDAIGGINNLVLHLTSDFEDQVSAFDIAMHYKELAWGLLLDKAYQSLEEIIARTSIDPSRLCIENNESIPFTRMYDIMINDLGTSICLDVGHMILQGEEQPADFVARWQGKVHEIHLHNVLRKTYQNRVRVHDDHHGLERGVIDVPAFLHGLEAAEFQHPVLLEIQAQREITESLEYLRRNEFL